MNNKIKISIITVSYDAAKTIEQTIYSVINQTYDNIEYIIIDGGSTDRTVDIIKKNENEIAYWVSESDKGIYDAMNKGIDVATGDYIYFLGADDWLVNKNIIYKIASRIMHYNDYDFYCGNVILYDSVSNLVKQSNFMFSVDEIKKGNMYPHQGMFVKKDIMKRKFSLRYNVAADFEFFLRNIINKKSIYYMNEYVAYYNINGISSNHILYDEYKKIILEFCGEKHIERVLYLEKYNNRRCSFKKLIKKLIVALIGRRYFKQLMGWKDASFDYNSDV